GNAGAEITADCGSADKHDFRLILIDNGCKSLSIRLCSVSFKNRIINNDNSVCAVLCKRICKAFYIAAEKNGCNLSIKICCKILCFSEKLVSDRADLTVYLLSVNENALILFYIFCNHYSALLK